MTGIVKTDQIQGAQGTTVTVPSGNTLAVTSNATVGGTLGVTGTATLSGNATIGTNSGDTRFSLNSANQYTMVLKNAGNIAGQIGGGGSDVLRFSNAAGGTIMEMNAGQMTLPLQPAFSAGRSSTLHNFAINSMTTINLNSEIYDQNGDFSDPNFTAPVTGKYQLSAIWYMNALDISAAYYILRIATSNRSYDHVVDSSARDEDETYSSYTLSILADMDAGDTASIGLFQQDGAAQTDITGGTWFSGYLVC